MQDTTSEDQDLHWSVVLEPGEIYHAAHGLRIENDSNYFKMYVQIVDELTFKTYRTFDEGKGFRIYSILEKTPDEH